MSPPRGPGSPRVRCWRGATGLGRFPVSHRGRFPIGRRWRRRGPGHGAMAVREKSGTQLAQAVEDDLLHETPLNAELSDVARLARREPRLGARVGRHGARNDANPPRVGPRSQVGCWPGARLRPGRAWRSWPEGSRRHGTGEEGASSAWNVSSTSTSRRGSSSKPSAR